MKTIKQIANEIGISKQRVYRYIKTNHITEVHHEAHHDAPMKHPVKHYDDAVVTRIKSHFLESEPHHEALHDVHHETHQTTSSDTVSDAVIAMLKNELETKNKQIDDLTTALVAAQQTAAAAQALHAGTMHHLAIPENKKKPSWWSKLFGDGDGL